ncbi:type I-E CRISPR-associated protein Cas6/Cse3/CasE [Actinokineospora diospyrosa]|uniref:CRISPR system Cascade subunit CasE n=1 Tax=Actinokineospora diospyrosa TaxID=103728 RepID=A0ABT1IC86_9PSEU|nr:type I-E CRISPR-associated protein Cas6/Cse3/CasE [Actinokineospora diospyrosa]MCP2270252.1 CRISPR system Cascade subunit CasE [Actinokineospora diospyrosa]
MYLSRLLLNPNSPTVKRGIRNIHDMHRTLMAAYPHDPNPDPAYRQAHGVLWRIDSTRTTVTQLVQSATHPDWEKLPAGHVMRAPETQSLQPVLAALTLGRQFAFRLLANPTHFSRTTHDGVPRRLAHVTTEAQTAWLTRKASNHGFSIATTANGLPDLAITPVPRITGTKGGNQITVDAVRYEGHLVVNDPAALADALTTGIGRAKSYGCGLLSLAAPRTR